MKTCVICGKKLTGQQTLYRSRKCQQIEIHVLKIRKLPEEPRNKGCKYCGRKCLDEYCPPRHRLYKVVIGKVFSGQRT